MTAGRRFSILATLTLIVAAFAGCLGGDPGGGGDPGAGNGDQQNGNGDQQNGNGDQQNGGGNGQTYVVGTDAAYPPFEEIDEDGNFVGYDIDVMEEIASRNGWTIEWQNVGFEVLITSVQQGQVDMAISAMTITEERSEAVDFSIAYYEANQAITMRADDERDFQSLDDMRGENLRFGVQAGTTAVDIVETEFVNQDDGSIHRYDQYPLALQALRNGDVDVVMMDAPAQERAAEDDAELRLAFEFSTGETYGIAIQKGNQELLTQINQALAAMEEDGTLDRLADKWEL